MIMMRGMNDFKNKGVSRRGGEGRRIGKGMNNRCRCGFDGFD